MGILISNDQANLLAQGSAATSLLGLGTTGWVLISIALGLLLALLAIFMYYGSLWFQAYMSDADISLKSLIGMTFRQVPARLIVTTKIMAQKAGLSIDRLHGISTGRLEAHFLAGGDILRVMQAIIAAERAEIVFDYDQAAAMDLAGRDVFDAVRTSVFPRVIDCPDGKDGKLTLSAVAKNGVELRVKARVTVRTNMGAVIGGATEKTIIARVGQGIVTTIGSADSHMDVLQMPDRISKGLLKTGLDSNTAFQIVSIDIADIDIGENIGARLQTDQAHADMRVALAAAEARRAGAVARRTEMTARIVENRAKLILAEAAMPKAVAKAFSSTADQFVTSVHIPIGSMCELV